MIVVADSGPLDYLIQIELVEVLGPLYGRVLVPDTVAQELQHGGSPESVRIWLDHPPEWFEILADPHDPPELMYLDPGERAAISLAISLRAERLLADDWEGRAEAVRRKLLVTGTLGILAAAHRSRLLDFETAVERLAHTNFYFSPHLLDRVRQQL